MAKRAVKTTAAKRKVTKVTKTQKVTFPELFVPWLAISDWGVDEVFTKASLTVAAQDEYSSVCDGTAVIRYVPVEVLNVTLPQALAPTLTPDKTLRVTAGPMTDDTNDDNEEND